MRKEVIIEKKTVTEEMKQYGMRYVLGKCNAYGPGSCRTQERHRPYCRANCSFARSILKKI